MIKRSNLLNKKYKFKLSLMLLLSMHSLVLIAQVEIIKTGTLQEIFQIEKYKSGYLLLGNSNFVATYNDTNNEVQTLSSPTKDGYDQEKASVVDNNIFISSAKYFPHYFEIYSYTEHNNSWRLLWDTSGIIIRDFIMFDSIKGILFDTDNNYYLTKDGGISWQLFQLQLLSPNGITKYGDSTICVSGSGKFLISDNHGVSWKSYFVSDSFYPFGITFISRDTIVCSSIGNSSLTIWQTSDGGKSWVHKVIENFSLIPKFIRFKSINEGYFYGCMFPTDHSLLIRILNKTKSEIILNDSSGVFSEMIFVNDKTALLAGKNGLLLKWNTSDTLLNSVKQNKEPISNLKVYPNPANNIINIEFSEKGNPVLGAVLYDSNGKKVNKTILVKDKTSIDISQLQKGFYILRVYSGSEVVTKKIFKI